MKSHSFLALSLISISCMLTNITCFAADNCKTNNNNTIRLLAIAGSARKESVNKKALNIMVKAAIAAGAIVTVIDLADYELPVFDENLARTKFPENARKIQKLIAEADGILLASPEYNGLPSPLLLNLFTWASMPENDNPNSGLKLCIGKTVGIIAASPGGFGGIRNLPIVRELLSNMGMIVVPEQMAIGNINEAFTAAGEFKDARIADKVPRIAIAVINAIKGKKLLQNNSNAQSYK